MGKTKDEIKEYVINNFNYNLTDTVDNLRRNYSFDVSCQGTLPAALIVFIESKNFEDSIRKAISIGGDSDTIGCIVGGISEAYYGKVPNYIKNEVFRRLDTPLSAVVKSFYNYYNIV